MVAIIALIGGDLAAAMVKAAPSGVMALCLTLYVATGVALGLSYGQFDWAATELQRQIDDEDVAPHDLTDEFPAGVESAEKCWHFTFEASVLTVLCFLIAIWWGPVAVLFD